jgi:hypothetical protein
MTDKMSAVVFRCSVEVVAAEIGDSFVDGFA